MGVNKFSRKNLKFAATAEGKNTFSLENRLEKLRYLEGLEKLNNTQQRVKDVLEKDLKPYNPPKDGILEFYQELFPEREVAFSAMDYLKNPRDIEQFFKEYQDYLVKDGLNASDAEGNIRYIGGYYDKDVASLWRDVLEFDKNN